MPSQPISPRRFTTSTGKRRAPLVLVDDRLDLLDHEVADRLAEQGVLGREIEVHRPESTAPNRPIRADPAAPVPEC